MSGIRISLVFYILTGPLFEDAAPFFASCCAARVTEHRQSPILFLYFLARTDTICYASLDPTVNGTMLKPSRKRRFVIARLGNRRQETDICLVNGTVRGGLSGKKAGIPDDGWSGFAASIACREWNWVHRLERVVKT